MDLTQHAAESRSTDQTIYKYVKLTNNKNGDEFIDPYRMALPLLGKF